MEFIVVHRTELTWVVCGVLVGAVLAPLHGLVTGPFCAGCDLVYKWASIVRQCFSRYRGFMLSREVQDAGTLRRWWMLSESLLGTPMVELTVQGEHKYGFGRVVYKFCDAFHNYWFVFVPETGEYGWKATVEYQEDLRSKWEATFGRAWFVLCTLWTVILTVSYVVVYCALGAYDLVETVCQGWCGVLALLLSIDYYWGNGEGVVVHGDFEVGWWQAVLHGLVVMAGVVSRTCRWLAYSRPSPMAKVGDLCEQWKETMEDRAQIERLAQAFWREDGGVGPVPRNAVEALRAARAVREASLEA